MPNIKDVMQGRSDLYRVAPQDLHVEPGFNARDFGKPDVIEHVRSLALKIKAQGFDSSKPIKVKWVDDLLVIRDGECRHRAAMQLIQEGFDIPSLPIVITKGNNVDDVVEMVNSNDGRKLDAFEEADAFRRLQSFGILIEEIAGRIGKSTQYVNDRLLQGEADSDVRELVRDGTLPLTAAKEIVRLPVADKKNVIEKARKAKKEGRKVSVKEAQRATKGHGDYIPYGAVKKLHAQLETKARKRPKDEVLKGRLEGVDLVLKLA